MKLSRSSRGLVLAIALLIPCLGLGGPSAHASGRRFYSLLAGPSFVPPDSRPFFIGAEVGTGLDDRTEIAVYGTYGNPALQIHTHLLARGRRYFPSENEERTGLNASAAAGIAWIGPPGGPASAGFALVPGVGYELPLRTESFRLGLDLGHTLTFAGNGTTHATSLLVRLRWGP